MCSAAVAVAAAPALLSVLLLLPGWLQVSFRSYWTRILLEQLRNVKGDVSIKDISEITMIRPQDIVETLQVGGGWLTSAHRM